MNNPQKDKGFWGIIERFKIIVELIATLIVIVPILIIATQSGLTATIPVWLVLIIALVAVFLGFLIGRNPQLNTRTSIVPSEQKLPPRIALQEIGFNYQDSPSNHGWKYAEAESENLPTFARISDGRVGSALRIHSTGRYALDFSVDPAAYIGKSIEFVARIQGNSKIYASLGVQSQDGDTFKDVWLNFQVGIDKPRPVGDGKSEWVIFLTPTPMGEGWLKFSTDLVENLNASYGKQGWSFRKLRAFRLRGNLEIASIKVY